jgi:hypothetical protein
MTPELKRLVTRVERANDAVCFATVDLIKYLYEHDEPAAVSQADGAGDDYISTNYWKDGKVVKRI